MYNLMSEYFDEIFPLDEAKTGYIIRNLGPAPKTILDLGCASGELAIALSKAGHIVTGMDLNKEMIQKAVVKAKAENIVDGGGSPAGKAVFKVGDMTECGSLFSAESFNTVLCLGNTLVHLKDKAAIKEFLRDLRVLIKPKGKLIIQILNYAFILRYQPARLPDIETPRVIFKRRYEYFPDGERVEFITTILEKQTGRVFEDGVILYCLTPVALSQYLEEEGFYLKELVSDFSETYFSENSFSLVMNAVRLKQ